MSTLSPMNSNPEINSSFFNGQPEDYWIGRIEAARPEYRAMMFEAATKLRGQAYSKLGYVAIEKLDAEGRETDLDDLRSVHFTALQRQPDGETARIVGNSRLIVKESADSPLPIERYFPEVFENGPIRPGIVEVSRLIAIHEDPRTRHKIALSLIRSMIKFAASSNIDESYCIVEDPLHRLLNSVGIPAKIIGNPKFIEEQGGMLNPVHMDHLKVIEPDYMTRVGKLAMKNFFTDGGDAQSEGFYDGTFIRGKS